MKLNKKTLLWIGIALAVFIIWKKYGNKIVSLANYGTTNHTQSPPDSTQ